jgi:MFS family permease
MDHAPEHQKTLRDTPFPRFVCAQTADYMAYNILTVAVGWQIYDLTNSTLSLGLVGLVQFLPQFLLTLVVGHVADQHERRRVVMVCQAVLLAVAGLLAAGSFTHSLTEPMVLACACALGAARAFIHPTMSALLPTLLEPRLLPRALALSASWRQMGIIVGPALGGALYTAGAGVVYTTCTLAYVLSITALSGLRSEARTAAREPATLRSVLGGIVYIRSRPEILGAISLDLFSVLLGGATALLPVFARDILEAGPLGLGLLRAAPAAGALCMSLVLARFPMRHAGRVMFTAVAVFGAATVVFGLSRSFPLSLAALAVLGAADMVSVVVRASLVQLDTPDEMRGRVSAVNSIFIGTSNQLGEFESGVTAAWFGTVPAVVLGGVCTLVVAGLWMRLFPALLRRDRLVAGS